MKKRYLSLLLAVAMACYSGLPAYAEASEAFSEQSVAPEVVNVLEDVPTDTSIDSSADAIMNGCYSGYGIKKYSNFDLC